MQNVQRHFATIRDGRFGSRQVHYFKAGRGPVVVMLHQSPKSARDMLPAMARWQGDFTLIAPDTPGYGLSDPIGTDLGMEDFGAAVIEFLDTLGIERTGLYGFHTGAGMAMEVARQAPERITCVVSNGYVVMADDERADFLEHYLPPFRPSWDGSHLTWAWARLREQTIFFPWYRRSLSARMDNDVPDPATLQSAVVELMRAGDFYRVAYRAAFEFRGGDVLTQIKVPALVTAAEPDPLSADLVKIVAKSDAVTVEPGGSVTGTLDKCRSFLLANAAPEPPPTAATAPIPGRTWNAMVNVDGGQLRVRRNTDAEGHTLVVQHDAASSSDTVDRVSQSLVGHRPVLAVDLPGHGESDNTIGETDVTVARYRAVLGQALDSLGLEQVDFYGMWGGGLVGLDMAVAEPGRIRRLVMSNVLYHTDAERAELKANYTPVWEPDWYGGHLLMIWHMMRDQGLFWPWFKRGKAGIIWQEPYIDTEMVNGRVLEVFKAPVMWRLAYQSHFDYPTHDQLAQVKVPTLLCSPKWDPNYPHSQAAHEAMPHSEFMELEGGIEDWASGFMKFLDK